MKEKSTIVLVDDERNILTSLRMALENEGYKVRTYNDGVSALDALTEEPADHGDSTVLRFRTAPRGAAATAQQVAKQMVFAWAPAWLHTPLPTEPGLAAVLTPSGEVGSRRTRARDELGATARNTALLRGSLVHRLLQSLPDIQPERRTGAAQRFLVHSGRELGAEHDVLIAQVMTLLEDARFKPLFAPGSRAEVPIVGRLALPRGPLIVSGQIDRLAVTGDAVLIADYKTDRPAPRRPEDVPRGYLRQLALYRAVLAGIYPARAVRAVLVWTDVPDLMELPAEILDPEIARLTPL